MLAKQELKSRIEAKKKQLEADLATAKADGFAHLTEAQKDAKRKLEEIETRTKDGWDKITDEAAKKLNQLLN